MRDVTGVGLIRRRDRDELLLLVLKQKNNYFASQNLNFKIY